MNLSCIITTRNESHALITRTIAELRETAPKVEIIVVDDASDTVPLPMDLKANKVIRFPARQGIADARAAGIENAQHDWCMLLDAHMMFPHGWLEKMAAHFPDTKELISTTYISCDREFPSALKPRAVIGGCKHQYFHPLTPGPKPKLEFMFCTPMEPQKEGGKLKHEYEVPCVIGAAYLIHKEWWNHIMGSHGLKFYGGSDHLMSVKTWLCGGKVKVYGDLHIGHYCPQDAVRDTPAPILMANRLHIARCMLSDQQFVALCQAFARHPALPPALALLNQWGCDAIAAECRKRYTINLADWERKFNITPLEVWLERFGVK